MELDARPSLPDELFAVLDLLPAPSLVALDPSGSVVKGNRAFAALLGLGAEFYRNGRRLERDDLPLAAALRGAQTIDDELDAIGNSGAMQVVVCAAPLFSVDGRLRGAVATFTDVTESRRLADELREARNRDRSSAQRLAFLAEAGQRLSELLETSQILDAVSSILLPQFADCLSVSLLDENGTLVPVSIRHANAETVRRLELLSRSAGVRPRHFLVAEEVLAGGKGRLVNDVAISLAARTTDWQYRSYVERLAREFDLCHGVVVPLRTRGTVIGILTAMRGMDRPYGDPDLHLLEEFGRRAASALDNAKLYERERQASRTLQRALLPARLPSVSGLRFDAIYAPGGDEALVGGDWYDALEMPDGRVALSIGDVTGRGVTAAVLMARVRQTISACTLYETNPAKLLDAADATLRRRYPDAIVTALVGILDRKQGVLTYATAGHPPPYLRRADGSVLELPCYGLPLGLRTGEEASVVEVALLPGDLLLCYTDGLSESTHDLAEGDRRIREALRVVGPHDGARAAHVIRDEVLLEGSPDDVALLTVSFGEGRSRGERGTLRWCFDTRDPRMAHESRGFFRQYLHECGATEAASGAAELVFGELIGNAVQHAPGPVDVKIEWAGRNPVLHVVDRGEAFRARGVLPRDPLAEGGRGLYLVGALARSFNVERLPDGSVDARAELDVECDLPM